LAFGGIVVNHFARRTFPVDGTYLRDFQGECFQVTSLGETREGCN
jgi:hypothetical protein